MKIISLLFLLFICACSSGENSQEKKLTKKHYYTKKYTTLLVSDLVVGYTCKNVLHFGIPACIALDAAGDAGVITYQTKKYQKKVDAEIKEKGVSTAEPLDYNYKEFLLDVAIFAVMLVVL